MAYWQVQVLLCAAFFESDLQLIKPSILLVMLDDRHHFFAQHNIHSRPGKIHQLTGTVIFLPKRLV